MDVAPLVQCPVFVAEGDDLSVYASLDDAIRAVEGVDVEDGLYQVFDATGRRIHLRAKGVSRGRFVVDIGSVHLDSVESRPDGADDLGRLLRLHLRNCGVDPDDKQSLAALVELARQRARLD